MVHEGQGRLTVLVKNCIDLKGKRGLLIIIHPQAYVSDSEMNRGLIYAGFYIFNEKLDTVSATCNYAAPTNSLI